MRVKGFDRPPPKFSEPQLSKPQVFTLFSTLFDIFSSTDSVLESIITLHFTFFPGIFSWCMYVSRSLLDKSSSNLLNNPAYTNMVNMVIIICIEKT